MPRLTHAEFLKKKVGEVAAGKGCAGKGGPEEDKGKKQEMGSNADAEESKMTSAAESAEKTGGKGGPGKKFPSFKFKKLLKAKK